MSVKKRILYTALIGALFIGGFWIYKYYLLHKTSHLAEHIPASADRVVYLNTRAFWTRFASKQKLKQEKPFWKRSEYFKNIQSIKETGIDFLSDIAYFEYHAEKYFIALLKDQETFENTLKKMPENLFSNIDNDGNYKRVLSLRDSFTIAWNENFILFSPKQKDKSKTTDLRQLFSVEKAESLQASKIYTDVSMQDEILWFYSKGSPFKQFQFNSLKGFLRLGDKLELYASDQFDAVLGSDSSTIQHLDSLAVFYCKPVKHPLNSVIRDLSILSLGDANDAVISIDFNVFEKLLLIGGNEVIEKKFISYGFDDNFNKVEIVKLKKDTIQNALLKYRLLTDHNWSNMSNTENLKDKKNFTFDSTWVAYAAFNSSFLKHWIPMKTDHLNIQFYLSQKSIHGCNYYTLKAEHMEWGKLLQLIK